MIAPRCYLPVTDPSKVPPEYLVCTVTSEPGARLASAGLVKVLREHAALSSVDGILQRELPPDLAALATGPALGSEAAAELLARTELAAADAAKLDALAAAQQVDVAGLATEAKRAALVARVPVAGAEVAPAKVVKASEPALWAAIVEMSGLDEDVVGDVAVRYLLSAVVEERDAKLVDAGGGVEEVMP